MEPLTRLTKKDEPFIWESEQQLAFKTMNTGSTTAPALHHFDHESEDIIKTDAYHYTTAGELLKQDDEGVLYLVPYYYNKHSATQCNYDIYDKELIAMVQALEEWRPECEGAVYPLQLITYHKYLKCFMTKKVLNRRHDQWLEFSTCCHYEIL